MDDEPQKATVSAEPLDPYASDQDDGDEVDLSQDIDGDGFPYEEWGGHLVDGVMVFDNFPGEHDDVVEKAGPADEQRDEHGRWTVTVRAERGPRFANGRTPDTVEIKSTHPAIKEDRINLRSSAVTGNVNETGYKRYVRAMKRAAKDNIEVQWDAPFDVDTDRWYKSQSEFESEIPAEFRTTS